MSLRRQIGIGLRALLRPAAADREVDDEIEHYLAEATAAYRAQGLPEDEAQRLARLDLGSPVGARQQIRAAGWEVRIESLVVDLHRGARRLRQSPAFAVVAAATLALGIGTSTAMFSIVRPVLLQSLPYPDADRLVVIADAGGTDGAPADVTFGTFRELVARSRSLQAAAVTRAWQPTLAGNGDAERLDGQSVSSDYFRVLGIQPALGRDFSAADDQPGAPPVAIITDGLWRRRFGGDAELVGRSIRVDGAAVTVIGVMPREFENVWSAAAQIWRPLGYDPALPLQGREWGHHLQLLARVRSDRTLDAASRELADIGRTPAAPFPRPTWASLRDGLLLTPLHDQVTAGIRPVLRSVTMGTLLLLAIAAVNIISLMIARGADRRAENDTCAALGAPRVRLLTPLVGEALMLAAAGGTLGVALAYGIVDALVAFEGVALPRLDATHVDRTALALATALSATIGIVAGCAPGLMLSTARGQAGAGPRVVPGRHGLRRAVVAAEVALAMILLVGAGLLVRSVQQLMAVAPGFRPEGVLSLQVQTAGDEFRSPEEVSDFFEAVRDAARHVPGVASAALTSQLPLTGEGDLYGAGTKDDAALPPGVARSAYRYAVTGDYLETMGIALERGRTFEERDRAGSQPVALISSSLARHRFPGRDPLGQPLRLGPADNWYTVVGVVGDVKQSSLAASEADAVYVPRTQWRFADRAMWVVLKTTVDPLSVEAAVRRAIRAVNPNQPIVQVATMERRVAASLARQRLVMGAFYVFAGVALLLATIGIYGVLAGGVIERTREIAVRTAIGASRVSIISQVGRQALGMAAAGMIVGGAAAAAMSRGLTALLFEISPLDAWTYLGVASLLLIAAAASAVVPAWRAARIEPAAVLRSS